VSAREEPAPALLPLAREAVPQAVEKAKHFRLLNEPFFAESVCLDVLALEPENQAALVTYLLSLTDQFREGRGDALGRARAVVPRLAGAYDRAYFAGVISERWGLACIHQGGPGSGGAAYAFLREAMDLFEEARPLHPPGNDDAALRYNTCVRAIERHRLSPPDEEAGATFGDA
jgi:hypothetical protein